MCFAKELGEWMSDEVCGPIVTSQGGTAQGRQQTKRRNNDDEKRKKNPMSRAKPEDDREEACRIEDRNAYARRH